eukprot:jgi/Mesen1/3897/ME000208S02914
MDNLRSPTTTTPRQRKLRKRRGCLQLCTWQSVLHPKLVVFLRTVLVAVPVFVIISNIYAGGKNGRTDHGQVRNLWGALTSAHDLNTLKRGEAELWEKAPSKGWQPSSLPRMPEWPAPGKKSSGYLLVRCNGGLNQQRSAICNAVVVARMLNATLVLPDLDTNSYWKDQSGFEGIYDVDHFIRELKSDVRVVRKLPKDIKWSKSQVQMRPPRDAPPEWYLRTALPALMKRGVIYLTPFSHRLAEELGNSSLAAEWQRLRCRVNFHALRFIPQVEATAKLVVGRMRASGPFIAIHLRFEMDMLAFAGCVDLFGPEEQEQLRAYRKANFADKHLETQERRLIGKCPLTPEEVGVILRAMGYGSNTRLYIAAGDIFGGDRFMVPLRNLFPKLENRTSVASSEELQAVRAEGRGLLGPAVDYLVCLEADIFMPTYNGPSNFANNVMGHRLYSGFGITIQPNRKALARVFMEREVNGTDESLFLTEVKRKMGATFPRDFFTRNVATQAPALRGPRV